jgi:hypothetical protein
MTRTTMGKINSKAKGNGYEIKIANELSEIHNQKIHTNRYVNKLADDKGIDISTPTFEYQLKNLKTNANYSKLLTEISKMNQDKEVVLLSKVTYKGEYAIMSKEIFYKLLKRYIDG